MSDEHSSAQTHRQPRYVAIAAILAVLTVIEVLVSGAGGAAKIPILLVLAATKAALVAMFFMHLRYDSRLFSTVFVAPLLLGAAMIISLLLLLGSVSLAPK